MEHWLSGGGMPDYPATWEGLYNLLVDANFPVAAADMKRIVSSLLKDK